jgi:serine/threonine protein kinase
MGPTMSSTLQPGQAFGRYQIVRTIGVGSFGIVYEAVQYPLERRVALKLLHDRTLTHPDALARFEREAMAAARLRHPNSVEVVDYGAHEGVAFLAMELLEGESLQALMRRAGPLPVETIVDLVLPIVSAVAAVHDVGVVHRDLKPENFLLTVTPDNQWHPKLLDFGIAKMEAGGMELTRTNALLGTPCYMSPEQVMQARSIDGRSDQWSIGVVLYEGLTGRKPFYSDTLLVLMTAITADDAPPLRGMRPDVHPALEAIIARAMQRRPEDRYPTMRDLGGALLPFASAAAQQRWYAEFMEGQYDAPPVTTSRSQFPPAPAAPQPPPSFAVAEEDATQARQSSLPYRPATQSSPVVDEPTELVNTTSQDGEFPRGFPATQGIRPSGPSPAAPAMSMSGSHDGPGSRTMTPHPRPSDGYPSAPEEPVGTGTLAMDIDQIRAMPPRQATGKMPAYKSTVEMSSPIAPSIAPVGPGGYPPPPAQGPYGPQGSYNTPAPQGPYGPVLGMPGGPPIGTLSLASSEVSRPNIAPPPRRGGRVFAAVALLSLLGAGAFAVVFWKARSRGDDPTSTTRPAADASVRAAAPDAPSVAPTLDAQAVAVAPDAQAVAVAPDAQAVAVPPDAAAPPEEPLDAAVASLDAPDPEPEDAEAPPTSVRGTHRRDAGRVGRDAGRRPPGGRPRPNVPIF